MSVYVDVPTPLRPKYCMACRTYGSVLGPVLFVLYTADLLQLVIVTTCICWWYANHWHVLHRRLKHYRMVCLNVCLDAVSLLDGSQLTVILNHIHSKTEALRCSSIRRRHQIPTCSSRQYTCTTNFRRSESRGLPGCWRHHACPRDCNRPGVFCYTSADTFCATFTATSSPVNYMLRALVISKLDYCNSMLAGAPEVPLRRLQSVLNAAARLVFSARKSEHTSSLLRGLHWLRVPERISFRLCVLTYRCLHGEAPSYLAETIHPVSSCSTRHVSGLPARHLSSSPLIARHYVTWRPRVPSGCSKSLELLSPSVRCAFHWLP